MKKMFLSVHKSPRRSSCLAMTVLVGTLVLWSSTPGLISGTHAQSTPPITSSGLNTQVGAPTNVGGKVQYDITGGTRPGNGPNLFHSFGEFGVPTNNIANFRNDSALATSNILSRVTGGNPSNIFGMIKTTDFGNANLFLMNPAGILFGPNATLNVGGSVHFTTANYLRLSDGARFTAVPGAQDVLLSTAPVAAFGFLTSSPAAISVQGSALSVPPGEAISLIGGNISIQAGALEDSTSQAAHLSAPGGQVRLASVASPGEILHPTLETAPNIAGQTFSSMGTITLSENATIDVSGDAAGTVLIRGGQLVIADATISADTSDTTGSSVAIDINVIGDLSISDTRGTPAITSRTTGAGDAGEVQIVSGNLVATSSFPDPSGLPFPLIDSHTEGAGKSGNISISTGNLQVSGLAHNNAFTFIDTGTRGPGHGADVTITANSIQLDTTTISTGDFIARNVLLDSSGVSGSAGNITISADSLRLTFSLLNTAAFAAFADTQQGGDININVRDISMARSQIGSTGVVRGGAFAMNADALVADATFFETATVSGPGGGITVNSRVLELTNGSSLISSTFGDGKAGDIQVTATDHVSLLGHSPADPSNEGIFRPSGLFSNSLGFIGGLGDAGNIIVTTPTLVMADGGRINTSTASSGRGGDVTIHAANASLISGEFSTVDVEAIFGVGPVHPSGVLTMSVGGACSGPCGDAGRISITTGSLALSSGGQINSGTSTTGQGGEINLHATDTISLSGTLSDGSPAGVFSRTIGADPGSGAGGKISLQSNQVTLNDRSSISAQSSGPGNAGNITITAADSFISHNSTVTTSTTHSDGGNIAITAGNLVQLDHSEITTNVQGGAGNGGNITIDPPTVLIDHSKIIASAIGGNGGNINIVAGVFLVSPDSIIDASSTFGLSGTINIESPIQNLSGTLAPLPQGFLQVSGLLQGRCAARVQSGLSSSLVVAGRDAVPLEPGDVLPGPIFSGAATAAVSRNEKPNFQMSQILNETLTGDGLALAISKGRC